MKTKKLPYKEYEADLLSIQKAKWITHSTAKENVLRFYRSFSSKGAVSARLIVCGLGFFKPYVNGVCVDERYFMPAYTDYEKRDLRKNSHLLIGEKQRFFVHAYDVTNFLQGNDRLEITVGGGYYHNVDRSEEPFVSYSDKKLIFVLRLSYPNKEELIVSDETTLVAYLPMLSGLYEGDFIDFSAREELAVPAVETTPVEGKMELVEGESALADKVGEILSPISVSSILGGILYDFGCNHSGGIVCGIRGARGRRVRIRFAEVLYEDGTPNYETSRWDAIIGDQMVHRIDQEGVYILSGGIDYIEPSFSWKCYRYAFVEDAQGIELFDVKSYFIHMDVKGNTFSCDNAFFNELHEKSRRTLLDNLHAGVLSDCPHREKRPYTGDGGVMAETVLYDLDGLNFLSKWLDDIIGSQTEEGFIPYTAPYLGGGGGYAWSNVIATMPPSLYRFSGDKGFLERSYPALVRWLGYYEKHTANYIVKAVEGQAWCLGDWLAPTITEFYIPFMSTLCYYQAAASAQFMTEILQNGDGEKWKSLKEAIARAINETFFDAEKVCYCKGIQGENVLPLAFGIVPKEHEALLKETVRNIYAKDNNFHLDTGIVATPILLDYLTENGMEELAYRIMTATDYPSYAYMLADETTLSEHWSKRWPDYHIGNSEEIVKGGGHLSHCHPMFGSAVAWLYKRVAGMDLTDFCDKKVRFAPRFVGWVNSASATVATPLGDVTVSWDNTQGFAAKLLLPKGVRGEIALCTTEPLFVQEEGKKATLYEPKEGKIHAFVEGNVCIFPLIK